MKTEIRTGDLRIVTSYGNIFGIEQRWRIGTGEVQTMSGEQIFPEGKDWVRLPDPDRTLPGVGLNAVYYYPRYERVVDEWRPLPSFEREAQ